MPIASPETTDLERRVLAHERILQALIKLPKRLDLARDAARAHHAVPGLIVANWVEGTSCDEVNPLRDAGLQ